MSEIRVQAKALFFVFIVAFLVAACGSPYYRPASVDGAVIDIRVAQETVKSPGDSGATGAVIGGLLFGPVGAVVGGLGTRSDSDAKIHVVCQLVVEVESIRYTYFVSGHAAEPCLTLRTGDSVWLHGETSYDRPVRSWQSHLATPPWGSTGEPSH